MNLFAGAKSQVIAFALQDFSGNWRRIITSRSMRTIANLRPAQLDSHRARRLLFDHAFSQPSRFSQEPWRRLVRSCLHIYRVRIEYADDFSNNLRAIFTIGEDNCAELLGGNKEGVGICSGVRAGVVDYGDTVVDDDLPAESHTC